MQTTVFQCEDSVEGILTGVYDAYASRLGHDNCKLSIDETEYELFCVYKKVMPSAEKTAKVIRTLRKEFGEENFQRICYGLASYEKDKANAVYKTIVTGLKQKLGYRIFEHLSDPYVMRLFALQRNVGFELMHWRGFIRFKELESGVLLAVFNPKNQILPLVMPHFADRFPLENFLLYDEGRNLAGIHYARKEWFLMEPEFFDKEFAGHVTDDEKYYQELFKAFQKTIEIKARTNPKLQMQMLPLRFRGNMTEFE
ncbi:MAG: DNA metabolism protein [Lachnospiraceae bacterium]|nr:DNA metabolism protein [Lachnospiraceae bacterium]